MTFCPLAMQTAVDRVEVRVDEESPNLSRWESPVGVLRDYEETWSPTSDAPREYHVAAGLAVIAATLENRIYLPFGGDRIYPNLWALLLGPSSFFRKSNSINKARKTLGRVRVDSGRSPLLPDEFSREALLKYLSERGQGLLTYSEFSGTLATFGRDYMSGTKELLADLYDCPETYTRVVGGQTWQLKDVCLSILAASQTDWFLEKLKHGDVRGGFLARFSFWPAFEKKDFLAVPPPPDSLRMSRLVGGLNDLRRASGDVTLLPDVKERYASWLERHERELARSPRAGEPVGSTCIIRSAVHAGRIVATADRCRTPTDAAAPDRCGHRASRSQPIAGYGEW